jgi:tetratricopeptide (TPR) repeat protein
MNSKFEQVKALVAQKKYKKALPLIRKINQKQSEICFETLALEVACLFNEKNYKLAYIKGKQLWSYASALTQKLRALNNLAAICEKLNMVEEAIDYLKESLDLDGSLNTTANRYSLLKFAFSIGDYTTVREYGPFLSNVTDYSIDALLLLAQSAINTKEFEEAAMYLTRIVGDIRTGTRSNVNQLVIVKVLNGFHVIKDYKKEQVFLNYLLPKYGHLKWYNDTSIRLTNINKLNEVKPYVHSVGVPIEREKNETSNETVRCSLEVTGSSIEIVQVVRKLQSTLINMGAYFHPALAIVEKGGEINVLCMANNTKNEILIEVPIRCMPIISDYRFSLDEQAKLCVKAKKKMLNSEAKVVVELLVQLYNLCDKLNSWKHSYPLFSLAGFKIIFDKLLQAQSNRAMYEKYYAINFNKISEKSIIQSFLGSRVMNIEVAELKKLGIQSKRKVEAVLLPIFDLINHKMRETRFLTDEKQSSIKAFTGVGDLGREVFVQYSLDDPLITCLSYGFVDNSAEWVYSVPLVLKTKAGREIEVHNLVEYTNPEEIPGNMREFVDYFPTNIFRTNKNVIVSKLVIPGAKHPHILRIVLSHMLKKIDFEHFYTDEETLNNEILFLEKQLIDLNDKYWIELAEMIKAQIETEQPINLAVSKQLNELCVFYRKHLNRYANNSALQL